MRVLLYHRVCAAGDAGRGPQGVLPADRFREQMSLLERWGFTPITFNDCALIERGELTAPRKPIILTFDDGYEDTYRHAVPVLQEFGMKAVMFVLADPAIRWNAWDAGPNAPGIPLMSERQITELHELGFEIGSHSLTHARLPAMEKGRAWEEIARSRMRLEILLNAPVWTFAYPYGLLNETLKGMVAEAGYSYGCSAWSGPGAFTADPYQIRRIEVFRGTGRADFAFKVLGPHAAYHRLRARAHAVLSPGRPAGHVSQVRTLLLVSAGLRWPGREEFARREAADQFPRMLPLFSALNADVLDERFLASTPARRSLLYRVAGTSAAQILETFRVRNRYDVIVSWAEHLGLPLAGLFRLTHARTPHVSIFSWISKPKKARILKAVHPSIDRIILMSSAQRDFAVRRLGIPASKIALLRWPVDEKFWRPLGGPQDMISSIGREMRDYRTLIEALRGTDIPCHIAAGGQLEKEKDDAWIRDIRDAGLSSPHITTGGMNFAELRRLYDRSKFVVIPLLPTDTDNGTTSILEAMAMGKAVICSRVNGQRDVIVEGKMGLFVPPGDPAALREAICHLWTHPEEAAAMGMQARAHVERHHSLDSWIEKVREVIDDVLVRNGAGASGGAPAGGTGDAREERDASWVHQLT